MMGYGKPPHFPDLPYEKEGSGKRWLIDMATTQFRHRFAAEVKGWMLSQKESDGYPKWDCEDMSYVLPDGRRESMVRFWTRSILCAVPRTPYANMDEHPRAVCEAAIAALKTEKGDV
jgi:hypothetical protein